MAPEEAQERRDRHAATQAAYHARSAVQRARIVARMAAEGRVPIRVDEFRPAIHGDGVFWSPTAWEGGSTGYRRMTVTHVSRPPKWSRRCSISGAAGDYVLALPEATIYVRPQ